MAITQREARQQIVDDLGGAVEELALAVACLTEAYEQLSVASADQLEAELFRPAQKAYGRARSARDGFASRFDLVIREADPQRPGLRSQGAKAFVEKGVGLTSAAAAAIAQLQDTMLPIEAGDAELRAGLATVRELLDGLPGAAREFLRTLGR